jgi:hypothetical protein
MLIRGRACSPDAHRRTALLPDQVGGFLPEASKSVMSALKSPFFVERNLTFD